MLHRKSRTKKTDSNFATFLTKHISRKYLLVRFSGEDAKLKDVCLIDCFRAHGVKVPYADSGPFLALHDGNAFLQPFSPQS